jgi:hypothetical protein
MRDEEGDLPLVHPSFAGVTHHGEERREGGMLKLTWCRRQDLVTSTASKGLAA